VGFERGERGLTVRRGVNVKTFAAEVEFEHFKDLRFVVDDQDVLRTHLGS
jgi:hypothetical protein